MDDQTIDDIARLREWLLGLTGKDWWVRRINGQYIAIFESAKLSAATYEQAREGWEHALRLWGWVSDSCEKWEAK